MARARNIKPGFFSNDDLVELPFETRLLFIGLWTIADRSGRILDRPKKIKMDVFPGDSVDVDECLKQLAAGGFIHRYEAMGVKAIQVTKWEKHQNPHVKEVASTIPFCGQTDSHIALAPDKPGASTVQDPEIPERAGLIPDSLNLIPDSTPLVAVAPVEVKPKKEKPQPNEQDIATAHWIFDAQKKANPTAKAPNFESWANEVRLLREVDGRSHRDICSLFRWAKSDSFWAPNIQSPAKLREKWDTLTERKARPPANGAPSHDADWLKGAI